MDEPRSAPEPFRPAWAAAWRVVTCQATREEILAFGDRDLAAGLILCWIVGIGRWWDDPSAELVKRLGLGSVAYPFALGALLWLLYWPWRMKDWRYKTLVAYLALTAPPAILYAIPVEMFMPPDDALRANLLALTITSLWRVLLLYRFFRLAGGLDSGPAQIAVMLPVSGIIIGLTIFNMATGVIQVMGGFRGDPKDAAAAQIGMMLTMLLVYPFMAMALYYLGFTVKRWFWPEPEKP